jgi:protein O-GlcNAc transferase
MSFEIPNIEDAIQLHQNGNVSEAEAMYQRILLAHPQNADALYLLGVILHQRKEYIRAEELVRGAIAINKRAFEYRNELGNIFFDQNLFEEAEKHYLKALKLNPRFGLAHNNLGNVLREKGRFREAAQSYQKALKLDPEHADIHKNYGVLLEAMDRIEEAIACHQEAIRLRPNFCEAYVNLASAYRIQGKSFDAIAQCAKALALEPAHLRAFVVLGILHSDLGHIDKAAAFFREALRLQPDCCEAHLNLANILLETGNVEDAAKHYQEAIRLKPTSLQARIGYCIGQIGPHHPSAEAIQSTRRSYRNELELLSREIDLSDPSVRNQAVSLIGNCQPFFLAYQGENDRELQSLYGNLMVRIQSACFPAWSKKPSMPALKPGEPLRIGIVSAYYCLHSNWKIPIKGWIENLNRQDFQLFGYYTGHTVDDQTILARQSFVHFTENVPSLNQWCERISKDRLHVLIFPEIGMDPMTVRLASLRLAPIQCTSWGHPDTSGLPTIDYYLSSDLMEPADAQDHYTEKIVRLPNLAIYYDPPVIEPAPVDRAYFGLRNDAVLFLCMQSLFKYLPQYDDVFPRIAMATPSCQFAFLNFSKSPRLGELFMKRLETVFARFGLRCEDFVKLLPSLDPARYRALNLMADVFLDSIGWSGCNSTLEAMACNLPIATMPGQLMRGRHTHAILKMMGYHETEAKDIDEYVAIASRLGNDPEWRKHASEEISRRKHLAYHDTACIRGLEEFLKTAVASYS